MTVEDSVVQPDEDFGEPLEGIQGTEQPQSTAEDDQAAVDFFTQELGIPVPESMREQMEPQEEPEPEGEPEPQDEPDSKPGWQQRREGLKTAHKRLQAEHEEVRRFTDALLQTVSELTAGRPAMPATAQPVQEPEPEAPEEADIDIFEDPDGAVNQRVARIVAKEIVPLRAALAALISDRQRAEVSNAEQVIAANLTSARVSYSKENPGYEERAQAFQRGYMEDLIAIGYQPQEAFNQFSNEVRAIIETAVQRRVDPIRALDQFARRYSSAGAAPAAPAARRAPSDRIAAASAAAGGGVARPGPDPSSAELPAGELTVDSLRAGGVKPAEIREMLRQRGGRGKFFELARRAEEAESRARR